jgi:hypothetical protein
MFKITNVHDFIQKKIARNNMVIEIFKSYEEILNCEIKVKKNKQEFYENQQSLVAEINDIEILQLTEYTVARQNQINILMEEIGGFKPSAEIINIIEKIKEIKNNIKYKSKIINHIQTLIPNEGIATNYTIKTSNPSQTCASAIRGIQ